MPGAHQPLALDLVQRPTQVSWVATASSSSVESSARRVRPVSTPVTCTTWRTASKIRSGRSEARNLARHNVSTLGWKPRSVNASPQATFQAMLHASCWQASRSDRPSNDCSTITVATTSAGTEGRSRPEGKQVREQLVREQVPTVVGQEGVARFLGGPDGGSAPERRAARHGWVAGSLHARSLPDPTTQRELLSSLPASALPCVVAVVAGLPLARGGAWPKR